MSWMMYVCLLGIARPANIMTKSPIASTSTAAPAQLKSPGANNALIWRAHKCRGRRA